MTLAGSLSDHAEQAELALLELQANVDIDGRFRARRLADIRCGECMPSKARRLGAVFQTRRGPLLVQLPSPDGPWLLRWEPQPRGSFMGMDAEFQCPAHGRVYLGWEDARRWVREGGRATAIKAMSIHH